MLRTTARARRVSHRCRSLGIAWAWGGAPLAWCVRFCHELSAASQHSFGIFSFFFVSFLVSRLVCPLDLGRALTDKRLGRACLESGRAPWASTAGYYNLHVPRPALRPLAGAVGVPRPRLSKVADPVRMRFFDRRQPGLQVLLN